MKRILLWFSWLIGIAMNIGLTILLTNMVAVPVWFYWTVWAMIVFMDGFPLMWILGIVKPNIHHPGSLALGVWFIFQSLIFVLQICLLFVWMPLTTWLDWLFAFLVFPLLAFGYIYFRVTREIQMLS